MQVPGVVAFVALAIAAGGCGDDTDPSPSVQATTTMAAPTTSTSMSSTSIPLDVSCGNTLPFFPTHLIRSDGLPDIDGIPGPAPRADSALDRQLVQHWSVDDDITIEMRWPAGSGPTEDSPIAVTQLVSTGAAVPCDVTRISAYGPQAAAVAAFTDFVANLQNSDDKATFITEAMERLTPAPTDAEGRCSEPILVADDADDEAIEAQIGVLLERYASDRTDAAGYQACFTVAGLRDLEANVALHGVPDFVRPSSVGPDDGAETVATFLEGDSLTVLREMLSVVRIPEGEQVRLLFSAIESGPDSLVGEDEAVAYIDEFLALLGRSEFEQAARYLVDVEVSPEVLEAMPTIGTEPGPALEAYCRTAVCDTTYKVNDTLDFEASWRLIEVVFFDESGTIEHPMRVGVEVGQLSILTPPPLPSS